MMSGEAEPAVAPLQLPRLMSIGEAAAYFNRTTRTMSRWIADGALSVVRVGGGKFVLVDEVQDLISEQIAHRSLGRARLGAGKSSRPQPSTQ